MPQVNVVVGFADALAIVIGGDGVSVLELGSVESKSTQVGQASSATAIR